MRRLDRGRAVRAAADQNRPARVTSAFYSDCQVGGLPRRTVHNVHRTSKNAGINIWREFLVNGTFLDDISGSTVGRNELKLVIPRLEVVQLEL